MRHWLIYIGGEPAGLMTLRAEPDGEIEIVSFGLVPDRQGTVSEGLALAVDLALTACEGEVSQVWLHRTTSTTPALCPVGPLDRSGDRTFTVDGGAGVAAQGSIGGMSVQLIGEI
jgi:hypothetical protein